MNELYAIEYRTKGSQHESSWELHRAYGSRDSAEWNLDAARNGLLNKEFRIIRYVISTGDRT